MNCINKGCDNDRHRRGYCKSCWSGENPGPLVPLKPSLLITDTPDTRLKQKKFNSKGK